MVKRQVFYSFHFDNDVMRVNQIRNICVIEGNTPISASDWESIKKSGYSAIKKWIDDNMKYRSCVVVFVGTETKNRKWVKYEIKKAWDNGRDLLGIYIHNIKCPRNGTCSKCPNPFYQFSLKGELISSIVKCYNPKLWDDYNDISDNIENWIEEAIEIRNNS